MENNNFKDFTNLYEITKTLRFELKPTDEKSKKAIEIKNFETDFLIKNNRKKLFFYIDELLLEYIQIIFNENNLSNLNLNYYSQEYIQNKNNKEKKKNNKYTEENKLIELLIEKFKKVKIQGINEKDFSFKNWQYALKWENSKKYTQIFFKEILHYKIEIFTFVKEYYKYFMKWKSTFPNFEIIKNTN